MHRRITPRAQTYEFIDGSFRPDTEKILQLLSGLNLYDRELAAIRELLQNAFDSVKEEVAYDYLSKNRKDKTYLDQIADTKEVHLRVQFGKSDGQWDCELICRDDQHVTQYMQWARKDGGRQSGGYDRL